jgi:hypothetical protein
MLRNKVSSSWFALRENLSTTWLAKYVENIIVLELFSLFLLRQSCRR